MTKHNVKKVTWQPDKWGAGVPVGSFLRHERTGEGDGRIHIEHNDGSTQEWSCGEGTSALEGGGMVSLPEGATEIV